MAAYVKRAKSAFFATQSSHKPLTTLEAFLEAAKVRPQAAAYWLGQLGTIREDDFVNILADIPDAEISAPARAFACKMLETNKNRLLQTGSQGT